MLIVEVPNLQNDLFGSWDDENKWNMFTCNRFFFHGYNHGYLWEGLKVISGILLKWAHISKNRLNPSQHTGTTKCSAVFVKLCSTKSATMDVSKVHKENIIFFYFLKLIMKFDTYLAFAYWKLHDTPKAPWAAIFSSKTKKTRKHMLVNSKI